MEVLVGSNNEYDDRKQETSNGTANNEGDGKKNESGNTNGGST
jgi:hypothetical protein